MKIRVMGEPAPQGSMKHVGRGRLISASKKLKPWRAAVKAAVSAQMLSEGFQSLSDGPVEVSITFYLKRPKAHLNTRGELKPSAPSYVTKRPDLDKLVRSTLDAMTEAGVWTDDNQVSKVTAVKVYGEPGAEIAVMQLRSPV